jgi:RimJ/RimL family protein N-acetyltransferase
VRLALLAAEDRRLYHALYSSAEVMRAIGPPLATPDIDAQMGRVLRHNRCAVPGHRAWAISSGDGDERFGLAALLRGGNRAELGILLLPTAWRRGIATSAFDVLLPYAFGALGLQQIDASRSDDGHAAVIDRLLTPFGFRPAAGLRPGEKGWSLSLSTWSGRPRA